MKRTISSILVIILIFMYLFNYSFINVSYADNDEDICKKENIIIDSCYGLTVNTKTGSVNLGFRVYSKDGKFIISFGNTIYIGLSAVNATGWIELSRTEITEDNIDIIKSTINMFINKEVNYTVIDFIKKEINNEIINDADIIFTEDWKPDFFMKGKSEGNPYKSARYKFSKYCNNMDKKSIDIFLQLCYPNGINISDVNSLQLGSVFGDGNNIFDIDSGITVKDSGQITTINSDWLLSVYSTEDNISNYKGVKSLFDLVNILRNKTIENMQDMAISTVSKELSLFFKDKDSFNKESEYIKWSNIIKSVYTSCNGLDNCNNWYEYFDKHFKDDYNSYKFGNIENISNINSLQQRAILGAYGDIMSKHINIENPLSLEISKLFNLEILTSDTGECIFYENKDRASEQSRALMFGNSLQSQIGDKPSLTLITPTTIANNFYYIVQYLLPQIYGYTPTMESDKVELTDLQYNQYIERIYAKNNGSSNIPISYTSNIGEMKNVSFIDDKGKEAFTDLIYNIMIIATYADASFSALDNNSIITSGIELVDEKKQLYTNKQLDNFLSTIPKEVKDYSTITIPTEELRQQINCYIQISKGLDYLGLRPFTPELIAIYSYCNGNKDISKFGDNPDLSTYNPEDLESQPFRNFFDIDTKKFSQYYLQGVALSSTYVPLVTNLYEPSYVYLLDNDNEFVSDFHYKYGFYRKALFIDTDKNSAVNRYITGNMGNLRVATLEDLFNYEQDITLYVDTGFYNVYDLEETKKLIMMSNKDSNEAKQDEEDKQQTFTISEQLSNLYNSKSSTVLKIDGNSMYSQELSDITQYGVEPNILSNTFGHEGDLLSSKEIDEWLDKSSYSPLQPFAVVSALYRSNKVFNICNSESIKRNPVFISSPNLAGMSGIDKKNFSTLYSYSMLSNIDNVMGIDYKSTLDLTSPLFIDIYGNISTQSGIVVIPASSNPMLHTNDGYTFHNIGFLTLSNKDKSKRISTTYNNSETFMGNDFAIDTSTYTWYYPDGVINGKYVNFRDIPTNSINLNKLLYDKYYSELQKGCIDFNQHVNLIVEVLRGAPIENINFDAEGLSTKTNPTIQGIYLANLLDKISDWAISNTNGNSLLDLPNIAFLPNIEYILIFVFKILLTFMLLFFVIKIYKDAVVGGLGIRTILSFLLTISVIMSSLIFIPKIISYSYYQINKLLLKDEVFFIEMLNLEKKNEGKELSITEVKTPDTSTELYLKLDNVTVPWWSLINEIVKNSTYNRLEKVYNNSFKNSIYYGFDGVEQKNDGLYLNIDTLFNSSKIELLQNTSTLQSQAEYGYLYQYIDGSPVFSYCIPYYAIIDSILNEVQRYNMENGVNSFNIRIQNSGVSRTSGILEAYFTSNNFMETGVNLSGLYEVYNIPSPLTKTEFFTEYELEKMRYSMWYNDNYTLEEIREKLQELDEKAKLFIMDYRQLLTKVTDETFIKVMALYLSLEHNKLFEVPCCNNIEIFELDTRDLIRVSLSLHETVMNKSSMSFSRFVYDEFGTFGVISVSFLLVVYWVSSIVKPLLVFSMIIILISIFLYDYILRGNNNKSLIGYFITIGFVIFINFIYALLLKLTVVLPNIGITGFVSALFQVILNIAYIFTAIFILRCIILDYSDYGMNKYVQFAVSLLGRIGNVFPTFSLRNKSYEATYKNGYKYRYEPNRRTTSRTYLRRMNNNYSNDYTDDEREEYDKDVR